MPKFKIPKAEEILFLGAELFRLRNKGNFFKRNSSERSPKAFFTIGTIPNVDLRHFLQTELFRMPTKHFFCLRNDSERWQNIFSAFGIFILPLSSYILIFETRSLTFLILDGGNKPFGIVHFDFYDRMTNQILAIHFFVEVKMNKIISKIRVSELDSLSDVLVRLYKDAASDEAGMISKDANLLGIMAQVEKLSADITTAIKSDKTTSNLDEADIARDSVIRNLSDALNGYAAIPVPSRKAAAEKLLSVFNKYGKQIITKSYAEESSLIESMLEDFAAENLKSDIESLEGISDLIASLRTAQDSFNSSNDAYTNASVNKGE